VLPSCSGLKMETQ